MLQYPSIPGSKRSPLRKSCIAFFKYDGSNLRWEYSPKQGWTKYGTRNHLFDENDSQFADAIPLFKDKMAEEIEYRVKQLVKQPQRITVFTEYFGAQSFAGGHVLGDPKELKLIDVFLYKQGRMRPRQFLETFGDMAECAEVIYEGDLTAEFIRDVRMGRYQQLDEGVVAKGDDYMVKIKTQDYIAKLKAKFSNNWEQFGE
jgi:hypothetical protein